MTDTVSFPTKVSFTITNVCNLHCQMCGQWSQEGYMHGRKARLRHELGLADWQRLVDELASHQAPWLLIRGGEPFLFPGMMDLLRYINSRGLPVSIDTNGTLLEQYAADLVRLGRIHLTVSVDGPEEIHDQVRGVPGCFKRLQAGLAELSRLDPGPQQAVSRSLNFTISPYSVAGLGAMPDVARQLGVGTICIVPYYYVPAAVGQQYERELHDHLGCAGFTWRGFHHETSGVDWQEFQRQHRQYLASLDGLYSFPYMPLSEEEYRTWFTDPVAQVGSSACASVETLLDVQPDGTVNFCVDFPDYAIGNVREATLAELWRSPKAERFRSYRRQQPLAVCHRCGAKYMGLL